MDVENYCFGRLCFLFECVFESLDVSVDVVFHYFEMLLQKIGILRLWLISKLSQLQLKWVIDANRQAFLMVSLNMQLPKVLPQVVNFVIWNGKHLMLRPSKIVLPKFSGNV